MMNSSSRDSPQQQKNLNEYKNVTTILPPEITSTPCISNKTKIPGSLITPTRKFLGPKRYALSNNGMMNPMKVIKDPPGPLLASTAYNVNVSTYIDTKSPGYAGRLVQYNEETSRKQQNTHQERYGSPGLLPIVHLFKKEVPVISPKPKKGTVRIGTPESRGYYSPEHSRLLLEGIVRNNTILKEHNNSNNSTRSVLDALQEISRKRIHVNDDFDSPDDNSKKFRRANGDGDYSKRNRVESPPSENPSTSPTTQPKKRLCTIDAVLASKTSSMYANYEMSSKRKSSEEANNRILPTNKKKCNSVETQTPGTPVIVREMKRARISKETDNEKSEKPVEEEEDEDVIVSKPQTVLKVLDDKPLEVIRKNRLGALLSALSGREIPSIPMEDRRKALDQEWSSQSSEKSLVSILSPQNKQTKSAEKHVTFNMPKSTESTSNSSSNTIEENKRIDNNKSQKPSAMAFSSSTSSKVDAEHKSVSDNNTNIFGKTDVPQTKTEEKGKVVGGFKFDLNKPIDPKTTTSLPVPQENKIETPKTKPEITKSPSTPNFGSMFGSTPKSDSGGIAAKSTPESLSGKSPSTVNSLGLPTSLPLSNLTKASGTSTSGSFTFGTKSSQGIVPTETKAKETPVFTFGQKENMEKSTIAISTNSIVTPTTGKPESSSINSSPFGLKTVASETFAFNSPSNTSTVLAASTFSTTPTPVSKSTFPPNSGFSSKTLDNTENSPSSKITLGTSNSSPGGFKFSSGNSLPAFGSPSLSTATTTTSSNVFGGSQSAATSSSNNLFDTSGKTSSTFGSTPTSSAVFGGTSQPNTLSSKPFVFGSTSDKNSNNPPTSNGTSAFKFGPGQNGVTPSSTTSTSSSNLQFASPASNPTNMFSSAKKTPAFGAPTTSSNSFNFGAPKATTSLTTLSSTNSLFSTTNTTTFGTTSTTSFGTTTTPSFGTINIPSFSSTSAPTFGTTSAPTFGTTSAPSFGSTSAPTFGNTSASTFGTTSASTFGTTSAPTFGTTSAPTFGSTTAPSFGTTTTTSFASSSTSFGTPSNTSFNTNATSFGAAKTPTFGTTSASSFGTTNTSTFGTTNTPTFGTSNTPAPSFGTTNTPTFGTTNTPTFGTTNTATPNFGASSVPSFGANTAGTFGTTNTPSFSTSNTSFNSTSTPSFGTVSSTSFGTTNASNFATAKTNLFGNNPPPLYGATNTNTNNAFGVASTTATPFGTNTPTFGSPTSSVFGNATTSGFGSTNNAGTFGSASSPFGNTAANNGNTFNSNNTSTFGNASATNSFNFNSSNNTQFPAVTASGFGTNTNNTFGSSNAPNAFGASSTNSGFGSSTPASPFGSNANSTPSNAFAFGKKPEQASSSFPSATNNMFNGNTSFGSSQANSAAAGASSSSGVFTFGSSGSNAPGPGVFAFGATEPPKTFNFNASSSSGSAPSPAGHGFNSVQPFAQPSTAAPNMFSIGSGNAPSTSQARGRPLVRARRRT